MTDIELWLLRALWLITPFAAGPVFEAALDEAHDPFAPAVAVGLWVVWAAVLIVLMVPRSWSLTAVRILIPAAAPAIVVAAFVTEDAGTSALFFGGLVVAVAGVLAWRAPLADLFVDGSSYGDETRFLLRTPGPLAVGPLAVVWLATVVGAVSGVLLLLAERWLLGAVAVVVGVPIARFGVVAIHRLSERWLVFVPAGVVVHDRTALREPQLFRRQDVAAFGPAPVDSDEEDLTLDAIGLALRVRLNDPSKISRNGREKTAELTEIDGFLVTPVRPGRVLAEARSRNFPIG